MRSFLDAIRPLVASHAYFPGPDMGTSAADFADLRSDRGGSPSLGQQEFEVMPLEDQLTGYGVVTAARTACEWQGGSLKDARVAIEGFGKVGAGAAKYFAREAARIVAVSTIEGTLYQPDGIEVDRLLAWRSTHGDGAVSQYASGRKLRSRAALLTLPVDVLVPGARPDTIHGRNVDAISARLIVPAANIPYATGTPERLHARGIEALPDFVTNAGGVLAGLVELQGGTASDAFAMVRERITQNVHVVLDAAREQRRSTYDTALAIARRRLSADG
jgi:glutamate dehydrogenase (NAD(P)+)